MTAVVPAVTGDAAMAAADLRLTRRTADLAGRIDEFVARHPDGGVFHTSLWQRALERALGVADRSIVATRRGRVAGLLPLFEVHHRLLGRKLVSIPLDGCYGGPLAEDDDLAAALAAAAGRLAAERRARYLEIRSMRPMPALAALGFTEVAAATYSTIPLTTSDENWMRMDAAARRAVRKAEREGISVEESGAPEDVASFHRLLALSFRSFGTPVWGPRFLPDLRDGLGAAFRLLVARRQGEVIGGVLLLMYGRTAIYKYGACRQDTYPLRPFNLLLWRAIQAGLDAGCRELNTGAHDPADAGLLRFKATLGDRQGPVFFYRFPSTAPAAEYGRYFSGYRLQKAVWRRLPLPLTIALGSRINRWMC